jgi:hypothetical protein
MSGLRMKYVKMAVWVALGGLTSVIPLSSVACDVQQGKPMRPVVESQNQRLTAAADNPVYVPPQRGALGGRVVRSTRGLGMVTLLPALGPDHTGLTVAGRSLGDRGWPSHRRLPYSPG